GQALTRFLQLRVELHEQPVHTGDPLGRAVLGGGADAAEHHDHVLHRRVLRTAPGIGRSARSRSRQPVLDIAPTFPEATGQFTAPDSMPAMSYEQASTDAVGGLPKGRSDRGRAPRLEVLRTAPPEDSRAGGHGPAGCFRCSPARTFRFFSVSGPGVST